MDSSWLQRNWRAAPKPARCLLLATAALLTIYMIEDLHACMRWRFAKERWTKVGAWPKSDIQPPSTDKDFFSAQIIAQFLDRKSRESSDLSKYIRKLDLADRHLLSMPMLWHHPPSSEDGKRALDAIQSIAPGSCLASFEEAIHRPAASRTELSLIDRELVFLGQNRLYSEMYRLTSGLDEIANIILVRGKSRLALGDRVGALDDFRLVVQLARHLRNRGDLDAAERMFKIVNHLMACGTHCLAMNIWTTEDIARLQEYVADLDLDRAALDGLRTKLVQTERTALIYSHHRGVGISSSFCSEFEASNILEPDSWWRGWGLPLLFRIGPNGWYWQRARNECDLLVTKLMAPGGQLRERVSFDSQAAWQDARLSRRVSPYWCPENEGDILLQVETVQQAEFFLAICALERYQQTSGEYPNALQDLTPRFLESVPRDLYSTTGALSLSYRRTSESFAIWSVGLSRAATDARISESALLFTWDGWKTDW